ncbi:MAG: hypothetical protein ACFFDH_19335 [Promethearchaeota archaeon]
MLEVEFFSLTVILAPIALIISEYLYMSTNCTSTDANAEATSSAHSFSYTINPSSSIGSLESPTSKSAKTGDINQLDTINKDRILIKRVFLNFINVY